MKLLTVFFGFLVLIMPEVTVGATPQLPSAQDSQQQQFMKFFSIFPDPSTTYPTFTQLDSLVTLIFDTTLAIPDSILDPLRRYYAYLKQEAAQEYIQNNPASGPSFAVQLQELQEALTIASTSQTVKELVPHTTADQQNAIVQTQTAPIQKKITALTSAINQAIEENVAPNSLALCRATKSWQDHLKIFIANSYVYETQLLGDINQDEIKMFSYLPQFETAYYTAGYTSLRNNAEYVRIFLVITDLVRQRALAQCTDWSQITNSLDLYNAIETFKASDFYTLSEKLDSLIGQKGSTALAHFSLTPATKSSGASVAKGYENYFTCTQNTATNSIVLTARAGMESLFSVQNNKPGLTALGSYLLTEQRISPPNSTPYYGLQPTKDFYKLFAENPDGVGMIPTTLFIELLSFNAIRLINALLAPLFNQDNLSDTLGKINTLQENRSFDYSLFPNPLFYLPEDQLFLEELNTLTSIVLTTQASNGASQTGAKPASFWGGLWDDIESFFESLCHTLKKGFEKVGSDLWHAVQSVGNVFVHLAYAVEDVGIGLYYQTGLSAFVNGCVNGNFSYQGSDAASYFDAAAGQIHAAGNSLVNVVDDVADVAQQVVNMSDSIIAATFTAMGASSFGNNLADCFNEIGALSIGVIKDGTDFLIGVTASLVALAFEAVVLIEESVMGVLISVLSGGSANSFSNVAETGAFFAKDLVISILEAVTLFIAMFSDALKTLMMSIGYLVAAITNLVVMIGGTIMGLESLATGDSFWSGYQEVGEHTRLISAIVGLVLMTAITIATLGTASGPMLAIGIAMLVLGTAMMTMGVVGANQQDMQAIAQTDAQTDFVQTFSAYVKASIPAQYSLQAAMLNEMVLRIHESENNSDRGLVYYQNYLNNTTNTSRATQSYQLGAFYSQLLTPDSINYPDQKILPADSGYVYGIQTNRFDLNPSAGFRVYNAQRGTFAQEIATLPAPSQSQTSSTLFSTQPTSASQSYNQHFITQKDLSNLAEGEQISITVRWRVIYESAGDFYIGIYCNQNSLDTDFVTAVNNQFEKVSQQQGLSNRPQFVNAWNTLNTFNRYLYNFDNLSKAFVCYQNSDTNNRPALGIYEHSDAQFIVNNAQPSGTMTTPWFERGTWYEMAITLADNQISARFAKENDSTVTWSGGCPATPLSPADHIPYASLYQQIPGYLPAQTFGGSFGVITSGAAVEYEILYPTPTITRSTKRINSDTTLAQELYQNGYTPTETKPYELQSEQQWTQNLEQNLTPHFADWKLIPFSQLTVAQGYYVYATQNTNLRDTNDKPLTDFVIAAETIAPPTADSAIGQSLVGYALGSPFSSNTQYAISLVTGRCYQAAGQFIISYPDALTAYQVTVQPPQEISNAVHQTRQIYYAAITEGISFKNVSVTGVQTAIEKNNVPLYTCRSFTTYLSGTDYLVFVQFTGQPGGAQWLEPYSSSNTITSALSLVTGTIFTITAPGGTPVSSLPNQPWNNLTLTPSSGSTFPNALETYTLDKKVVAQIQAQTVSYNKAVAAAAQAAQLLLEQKQQAAARLLAQQQAAFRAQNPVPARTNNIHYLQFCSISQPVNGQPVINSPIGTQITSPTGSPTN